jgi:hypothetical protein
MLCQWLPQHIRTHGTLLIAVHALPLGAFGRMEQPHHTFVVLFSGQNVVVLRITSESKVANGS